MNEEMIQDIEEAKDEPGVLSNGGGMDINHTAVLKGVGRMPFATEGIANLVGMDQLVKLGFKVVMNSEIENVIFVEKNDIVRKFRPSENGLYFHDLWDSSMRYVKKPEKAKNNVFMQSQKENSAWYTKRQVQKAREARNLYQMMMFPSVADFKSAIKFNYIEDCPITVEDIEAAEKIFGKDIHALKGKTVRKAPYQVKVNTIEVPQEVLELHKNVVLGIDFFFVNGLVFL